MLETKIRCETSVEVEKVSRALRPSPLLTTSLTISPYSCKYCSMKTTIDFPDELLHRAKVVAAERRTTLRELVVRGLEAVTSGPSDEVKEKERKKTFKRLLKAMQASNTEPMQPLTREEIHDR